MQGFTGFTKAVTLAPNNTSSISFQSASGVSVACNRAYFTVSDGTVTSGVIIFIPSGVLSYTNMTASAIPSGLNASGLYGYHFVDKADIIFGHGRMIRGGTLTNCTPVPRTVIVTYGIVHDVNPMATMRLNVPI